MRLKVEDAPAPGGEGEGGFNSSLVRLKDSNSFDDRLWDTSFNSSLVRLKDGSTGISVTYQDLFQFQSGAIKSAVGDGLLGSGTACFNSSLVRLKE